MKRLLAIIASVLIAAILAISLVEPDADSNNRKSSNSAAHPQSIADQPSQADLPEGNSVYQVPRRLPGRIISGRTTLVNQLADGIDISDEMTIRLSGFIDQFRRRTNSVLYTHAAFAKNEKGLLQVRIAVPPGVAANLRAECYEEVAQIVGVDNLKRFAEMNRLQILDGDFQNYGEFVITITAEAKEMADLDLIHLRKETQRVLAGDPTTFWGEGDYLRPDLITLYGQIGEEIDRRVKAPSK